MRRYSRLQSLEEKKNRKTALVFGGLTIGLIVFFLFFGVPLIARLGAFVANLKNSSEPIVLSDATPPAPPQIVQPVAYTQKANIQIEGTAEPGVKVVVFSINSQKETLTNDQGEFSVSISLQKGENTVFAKAQDSAGNESAESKRYTIVFDKEPPELSVSEPINSASFNEPQITVKGTTETGAEVAINDRFAPVDGNGNFSLVMTLTEGQNSLLVKAVDEAGNQTEITLSVNFTR